MTDLKPLSLNQRGQVYIIWHYCLKAGKSFINWIKNSIFSHNKKHPVETAKKCDLFLILIKTIQLQFQFSLSLKFIIMEVMNYE